MLPAISHSGRICVKHLRHLRPNSVRRSHFNNARGLRFLANSLPRTRYNFRDLSEHHHASWTSHYDPAVYPLPETRVGGNDPTSCDPVSYFGYVAYVFLLRQFFKTIPKELSDAAYLDGAGDLRILWSIMLPLCRPALATIALLTFIGSYQDFLGPLVNLTNQEQWTTAIGLNCLKTS